MELLTTFPTHEDAEWAGALLDARGLLYHAIDPCFETRRKPPALEIFKRLPATNCGLCDELTCIAFAFRVWSAEPPMSRCSPLLKPEHAAMRAALMEIVAGLGLSQETA